MSGVIQDGTGSGFRAKVNRRNELQTQARTVDNAALKCVQGEVYLLSLPFYNVTTGGGVVAWMNFTDPVNYFVLDKLIPSYNGGSTNHNRAMQVEFIIGEGAHTTGTTPYAMANSNTLSKATLDATVVAWDGVTGSGMTGGTAGQTVGRMIVGQGYTIAPVDGKMIVGPNTPLSIKLIPEEDGVASFTGYFYLFDPVVDA